MDPYWASQPVNKKSTAKSYATVFLIIVAFFGGWYVGNGRGDAEGGGPKSVVNVGTVPSDHKGDVDFQIFWDLWNEVKASYVEQPVDEVKLFYGAMRGMMSGLGDPYSDFFDPATAAAFDQELSGSFSGIGVEIGKRNGGLVIIAPLEGSPGEKAGLKAGDLVLTIDKTDALNMSLDEAVSRIRGAEGTSVVLTVLSKNDDEARELSITRQKIEHTGMRWEYLADGIVHVKFSSFDQDTEQLLNQLVREIEQKPDVRGLVIDMRNNPGGFLEMSIEAASEWVEQGVIVRERDFTGTERQHQARGRARLAHLPTVVLINEGSASAAEILAGALQDYKLATLVGKTSFGKGSVQKYESLPDGSAYKLTVARWYTPLERAINEVGIKPDIEVELSEEDFNNDKDPQLDKALEILRAKK
jgi:carboxyl-terminal processing protease